MRIVGGRLRGRALKAPASRAIRPTSERLRESIFDILVHAYGDPVAGARVIDLFAGSGALGLEALSRGAAFALFVEASAAARALIRANIEALALAATTRIWRADATKLGTAPAPYSLAFLDPPYGEGLAELALGALVAGGWLAEGALCVVEESARAKIEPPIPLRLVEERVYGDTKIAILHFSRIQASSEGSIVNVGAARVGP
jgi:16S rRNA (guanine966-N2)-methyltransferase